MNQLARIAVLAALLVLYALALAGRLEAQARPDARLVELVAKVSFNEALDSYPDLALIWQITEAHGDTPGERAAWLAHHSPCVSGVRYTQDEARQRRGLCFWTRNLRPDGRIPRGWPHSADAWRHRMRPRWLAHLERVRALVRGRDPHRPCVETPTTWDGARWRDEAEARGFRVVECEGSPLNLGYVRRGADDV